MGIREDLQKRIEKKQQEISELELKIRDANSYIQGMMDTMKLLPKDSSQAGSRGLRPGTIIAAARDAIQENGAPMHIVALLKALGKGTDRNARAGLSGSISTYVKRGEIFTRPAPNTFGLIEFEAARSSETEEPPDTFGTDSDKDALPMRRMKLG
jgi:hypothetical protein